MITVLDIKKAVNKALIEKTGIVVASKDVDEDIKRPIFFTELITIGSSAEKKYVQKNSIRVRIQYYPKLENSVVDMYRIESELKSIFRLSLIVENRVLNIDEIESDIDEEKGFLYFTFKSVFRTKYQKEKIELMSEMKINESEV
ncbi:phage tail terminator family protein [Peptostreptococcus equinus]|uniref:Phage protein n=1 Tax=Peptostreptococcus equinus TaxID=3003601 RepID=A0ABY7JRR4_9FIRM|nr:hypothetical protein [Peptostreptococcus sp. CBA3647]WAW14748.1 hypothetical protein O0R46_09205 [Peptostreptococcus sp. CBA3647]